MTGQAEAPDGDLFYDGLLRSYITDNQRFVARPWLAARVHSALADTGCRFLLLTAEPGAGKTAFAAWLAQQNPVWPRYFVRRDQRRLLDDGGAHSLLLRVGFQLAATHPGAFNRDEVTLAVEQRLGAVGEAGQAVGAEVDRLLASPFYRTTVTIRQQVERSDGRVVGLRIGEWVSDPRLVPLSDLQYMALLDPAQALLRTQPDQQVVVLVDALDELRYRDTAGTLLEWLATCPELPGNVRVVLTSRPDDALLRRFRGAQQHWLREVPVAVEDPDLHPDLQHDVRTYAVALTREPAVRTALESAGGVDAFVAQAVDKANGNIGFVDAVGRATDQAVALQNEALLSRALDVSRLPETLHGLYAFFLHQIKDLVSRTSVAVEDPTSGEVHYLQAWPAVYYRVLGILSVAREPLTLPQLQALGSISVESEYLAEALDYLRQFLDQEREAGRYRLYHTTLAEFLTADSTHTDVATRDLHQDPLRWNTRIVAHYRSGAKRWADVDWSHVDDYGVRNLIGHVLGTATPGSGGLPEALDTDQLICRPFILEYQRRSGSHAAFASDVAAAIELATRYAEPGSPTDAAIEVRLRYLYAALSALASDVPLGLLELLAKVGMGDRAFGLIGLIADESRQAAAFVAVGAAQAERGDRDTAAAALDRALSGMERQPTLDARLLPRVARTAGLAGDVEALHRVQALAEADTSSGRGDALAAVAEARIQLGQIADAMRLIQDAQVSPEAQAGVAAALGRFGHAAEGRQFARALPDDHRRVYVLATLAQALAERGLEANSTAVTAEALALPTTADDIQALVRLGAVDRARTLIAGLLHTDRPSAKRLALLQEAARRRDAVELAAQLGDEVDAVLADAAESPLEAPDLLEGLAEVLAGLGDGPRFQRAFRLAFSLPDDGYGSSGALVAAYAVAAARFGDKDLIESSLRAATQIGDNTTAHRALSGVARAFALAGDEEGLERVMAQARHLDPAFVDPMSVSVAAAMALAEVGLIKASANLALRLLAQGETLPDAEDRVALLRSVARALSQEGRRAAAIPALQLALQVTEQFLERGVAQMGTRSMWGRKAVALADLCLDFAEAGDEQQARALALAAAREAELSAARLVVARAVATRLCRAFIRLGQFSEVSDLAEWLDGLPGEGWLVRCEVLSEIVVDLWKAGAHSEAVETVAKVRHVLEWLSSTPGIRSVRAEQRNNLLSDLAQITAQIGADAAAIELIDAIDDVFIRTLALRGVALELVQRGNSMAARPLARRIIADSDQISGEVDRADALAAAVQALGRAGEQQEFQHAWTLAWEAQKAVEDEEFRARPLAWLAAGAAAIADYARVEEVLKVAAAFEDEAVLRQVIGELASSQSTEVLGFARATAEQAQSAQLRLELLAQIAAGVSTVDGQTSAGFALWQLALRSAAPRRRPEIVSVLRLGATAVAKRDQAETLERICSAVMEVDSWWDS